MKQTFYALYKQNIAVSWQQKKNTFLQDFLNLTKVCWVSLAQEFSNTSFYDTLES